MNMQPQPPPQPNRITITIDTIIQIRLALTTITEPSQDIKISIAHLDTQILAFTASLNAGPTS